MINTKKIQIVNVKFGKMEIIEPVNLYSCEIKDNVFIGPFLKYKREQLLTKIREFKVILYLFRGKNWPKLFIGHGSFY